VILEYLYTTDLNVVIPSMPLEILLHIFTLASQYGVEPLKCKLEAILAMKITEENVCSLLLLADAHQAAKVRILFLMILSQQSIQTTKKQIKQLKDECCKYFVRFRNQLVQSSQDYLEHSKLIDQIIEGYSAEQNH